MKRLLAATLLIACAAGLSSIASAGEDRALAKWKYKTASWEPWGATAGNGLCTTCGTGAKYDTTFFDGLGTTSTNDTTEAIPTNGWAWTAGVTPNTASGYLRVFLYQNPPGFAVSSDSLFVAVDTAPTAGGPWIAGTTVGGVGCTTGEVVQSIMLLIDSDSNAGVATADKLLGAPWIRLRIKGDGNTAAKFPGARIMIGYPSLLD